jgi:hypothetical protein
MIIDDKVPKIIAQPKIHYLPNGVISFRRYAKSIIKNFFSQIEALPKSQKNPIKIEHKIVFHAKHIPYLTPAKESLFVYKVFMKHAKKLKSKSRYVVIEPQLRKLLSHKPLRSFKKNLRSMELVSRKRNTGFEYHLWAVAMHATKTSYSAKLNLLRNKLLNSMWQEVL